MGTWAVWTGGCWVQIDEENVEQARTNGYEVRFVPIKLEPESRDCTVFPRYCLEGFQQMEAYLAVL